MTIIVFRHFLKSYGNGAKRALHPFDAPLKSKFTELGKKYCDFLVVSWGIPKCVYTSPYLRTRQTAKRLCKSIKTLTVQIVDARLSEHIPPRWKEEYEGHPCPISEETRIYNPPGVETEEQVSNRLESFFGPLLAMDKDNVTFWVITHGGGVEWFTEKLGCKYYPNQGEFIVYDKKSFLYPIILWSKVIDKYMASEETNEMTETKEEAEGQS